MPTNCLTKGYVKTGFFVESFARSCVKGRNTLGAGYSGFGWLIAFALSCFLNRREDASRKS